jgi:FkbM family methyltransferase
VNVSPKHLHVVERALRQRVKSLHRRVLDPDVLRGQLPLRTPAIRRAALRSEARDRERRFLAGSPAYAAAIADPERFHGNSRAITLETLSWWVPLVDPTSPTLVARALRHQDFPYRVLSQTRDVSIGGVMIDVGANIGRMSIPRVLLGDALVAYCAEPDPVNYACLVRNVRENGLGGLVLPDHLAIGASDEMVTLERAKSAGGHRVIDADVTPSGAVVRVPCLPLDTWIARVGIDLDDVRFVKVDVQGSEMDVLRGATRTLAHKHIAWQIEIDLERLAARGVTGTGDLYPALRTHFTHFIDLNRHQTTRRVRPIADVAGALAYVSGGTEGRTDVVCFTLAHLDGNSLTS